ncbi:MAG: homoserine dehydrogenase [Thermodesulfobacteriota bacterium]
MDKINVGLIGFGTIGTGVARVLTNNASVISERLGSEVVLKRIADSDTERDRGVCLGEGVLVGDAELILNDPEIDIVIELVGGTGVAKTFVRSALDKGKHVVTANKALISSFGPELFRLAAEKGLDIGFEASVGGGIPLLKSLTEGLVANNIESMYGIINGTANYILSAMTFEGRSFDDILSVAQAEGLAEADPTYDVDGIDTAHKLSILLSLAYGIHLPPEDIFTEGIRSIAPVDIKFAEKFGWRIKLLAIARRGPEGIEARVHPAMIPARHPLSAVEGAYNALFVKGDAVGSVMLYGLGAGEMPTASAVVSDVVDICRNIQKGISRRVEPPYGGALGAGGTAVKPMEELDLAYYVRFAALDRPGVLSKIAGVFGDHGISLSSVIQEERKEGGIVPLVLVTHHAVESSFRAAVQEIEKLDIIENKAVYVRIEENIGGAE